MITVPMHGEGSSADAELIHLHSQYRKFNRRADHCSELSVAPVAESLELAEPMISQLR